MKKMIVELVLSSMVVTASPPPKDYRYYTPEGYEVMRFDCDLTRCIGVDGSYIGHPDNVMPSLQPLKSEHVNTYYYCDGFCYNEYGEIIGVEPTVD